MLMLKKETGNDKGDTMKDKKKKKQKTKKVQSKKQQQVQAHHQEMQQLHVPKNIWVVDMYLEDHHHLQGLTVQGSHHMYTNNVE